MSIPKNLNLTTIGRILVVAGILLAIAKWGFGMEDIGSWTLLFLVPGVLLTYLGSHKKKSQNDS